MLKYIEISKAGVYKFTWLYKIVFSIFLPVLLYSQLNSKISYSLSWGGFLDSLNVTTISLMGIVLLLMLLNWGIEARKWQLLLQNSEPLNFLQSFKAIMCGVTVSMFTPNRTAEFLGRMLFMKKENRLKAVSLSVTGGVAQWIVTLIMGLAALVFSLWEPFHLGTNHFLIPVAIPVILIGCCFSVVIFYKIGLLYNFMLRIKWLNKMIIKLQPAELPASLLTRILFMSFFRYIVFLTQYFILLKAFGINLNLVDGAAVISLILLTITLVPTIGLSEMGVRSNVALFFLSSCSNNEWGIVSSALLIWVINLLIPSLTGGAFIVHLKPSRSNYEKALA